VIKFANNCANRAYWFRVFWAPTFERQHQSANFWALRHWSARHIFYPICMIFIFDIQETFGNNRGKFQLKRLICSWEMLFHLHAPIKNAVKTGFSQKSTLDTQLCLKRRRTWTVWPKKTILESFCREMNALSSGYNTLPMANYCPFLWMVRFVLFDFGVSLFRRLLLGASESFDNLFYRVWYLRCCP
jgi:hypothetical protein